MEVNFQFHSVYTENTLKNRGQSLYKHIFVLTKFFFTLNSLCFKTYQYIYVSSTFNNVTSVKCISKFIFKLINLAPTTKHSLFLCNVITKMLLFFREEIRSECKYIQLMTIQNCQ